MANTLPRDKQIAVVAALTEGCSIRSTERMTGVNRQTVGTLLARVGEGCERLLDGDHGQSPLHAPRAGRELWSFVGKKARQVRESDDASKGDCWTWLAICAETKIVPTFRVGIAAPRPTRAVFVADISEAPQPPHCSFRRTGFVRT